MAFFHGNKLPFRVSVSLSLVGQEPASGCGAASEAPERGIREQSEQGSPSPGQLSHWPLPLQTGREERESFGGESSPNLAKPLPLAQSVLPAAAWSKSLGTLLWAEPRAGVHSLAWARAHQEAPPGQRLNCPRGWLDPRVWTPRGGPSRGGAPTSTVSDD